MIKAITDACKYPGISQINNIIVGALRLSCFDGI